MQLFSRRAAAARENGRKGGLATAQKNDEEFLEQRASKAGLTTKELYGTDFYRHISKTRKKFRPSTKDTLNKVTKDINPEILEKESSLSPLQLMQAAAKAI